jgi:hypothetical protein
VSLLRFDLFSNRLRTVTADTIYYLASTVAQTLASLAGFLGAFVLFYVQGTERSLTDYGDRWSAMWNIGDAREAALAGDFDQFEKLMLAKAHDAATNSGLADAIEQVCAQFRMRRNARQSAIGQFKRAVIVTAPVLLASLVLIEFAPAVTRCAALVWILSGALIVSAAVCGWLYWTVISACVGEG